MEDGAVTKEQQYAGLLQQRTGIPKRRMPSSFEEVSTCVSVYYREVKLARTRRTSLDCMDTLQNKQDTQITFCSTLSLLL